MQQNDGGVMQMQKRKIFGTDGVRGRANCYPLSPDMVLRIGRAAAAIFKRDTHRHKIVIGKDTRLSGYMIETALQAGITSLGVDILLVGPLPTPGIAFITSSMRADAGIVISASHNPFQDNGIKFFNRDGFKLPDEMEAQIERLIFSDALTSHEIAATEIGKAMRLDDARGRYIVYLKNTFPSDLTLEGLRIVLDCAHGAAYKVAPAVFEELGATVVPIGVSPNGTNINDACGAVHPDTLARTVRQENADLGIAFDGDADRVIFADEKGEILDGDQVMAICGKAMLAEGRLARKTLVATVMSNIGLDIAIEEAGGSIVKTQVGDRYVVEKMRQEGYNFGGEQSGHIVFLDHGSTGDGILSALQLLAVMLRRDQPLSELGKEMEKFPQVLRNVRVETRRDLSAWEELQHGIRETEATLGRRGRVLVRYSGTEPLLRIMVEGEDTPQIERLAQALVEIAEKG